MRRTDIEALMRPGMSREQLQALWLHRAVAGRLVQAPEVVLGVARDNLRRLRRLHPDGSAWEWLDRWDAVLELGAEAVLEALTSSARYAVELRVSSPFAGVLTEPERQRVLTSFYQSRCDHARLMGADMVEEALRRV